MLHDRMMVAFVDEYTNIKTAGFFGGLGKGFTQIGETIGKGVEAWKGVKPLTEGAKRSAENPGHVRAFFQGAGKHLEGMGGKEALRTAGTAAGATALGGAGLYGAGHAMFGRPSYPVGY